MVQCVRSREIGVNGRMEGRTTLKYNASRRLLKAADSQTSPVNILTDFSKVSIQLRYATFPSLASDLGKQYTRVVCRPMTRLIFRTLSALAPTT